MSELEPPYLPDQTESSPRRGTRIDWKWFWLVLLSPALLVGIGSAMFPKLGPLGLLGLPAGAICGWMLAQAVGKTESTRALLTVAFAAVLMVTSTALCVAGCIAGIKIHGPP